VQLYGEQSLQGDEEKILCEHLIFCMGLDSDYRQLEAAAGNDRVLATALEVNKGIRPKRYSHIFEAVCGAICAQNVNFRRLYQMMEMLAKRFGPSLEVFGQLYFGFPFATEVANMSVPELRECKVGYRADQILKAALWFVTSPSAKMMTPETLRAMDAHEALHKLCEIPGIGPYSASIVLSAGAGRQDIFHLDSFTRHILRQFYFAAKSVSDEELQQFVASKWRGIGGLVAHVLTTNTEIWAAQLGYEGFRRSGARA
jgi:3-methyladenine DNA glycosylase/8-oxoguanine DNA glycosylase